MISVQKTSATLGVPRRSQYLEFPVAEFYNVAIFQVYIRPFRQGIGILGTYANRGVDFAGDCVEPEQVVLMFVGDEDVGDLDITDFVQQPSQARQGCR